ncbi:MAG: PD-(D/E)XK nuclease family protein [Lachnospiraceae bacterium]|nr:PD-(D/E)XK nuclease family protein [Lachnospiraceae bacterium]
MTIERSERERELSSLLIVPDQFTMQTQADIVKSHPRGGILNIDVLSFERLCYRVFSEAGEPETPILDDTGKSLVLRRVASKVSERMPYIGRNLNKVGYIHEVKSMISEFMQYGISVRDVEKLAEGSDSGLLRAKLSDLAVIYAAFREFNKERFITGEEKLDVLCEKIPKAPFLKGAFIVFDGFTGFTPIQERVILKLLEIGCDVVITLTLSLPETPDMAGGEEKLFYLSRKTAGRLKSFARDAHVTVRDDILIAGEEKGRFKANPELLHLEKNLFRYPYGTYTKKPENIRIFSCDSPETEVSKVALTIHELVASGNYEYRDIGVIVGNLDSYAALFSTRMKEVGIPFFIDKTSGIVLNPFIEFLKSALQIIINDYSYNSVFHFLKSGFTDFTPEETDRFDRYVRSLNIRGRSAYSKEFKRRQKGMLDKDLALSLLPEINGIRERFAGMMSILERPAKTAGDYVRNLYDFIKHNGSFEKLKASEAEFEANNDPVKAAEYGQIYKLVMDLLDIMVSLIGEEEMTVSEFYRIFEAGINEIKVGSIPGSVDRVVIGDIERTRLNRVKALFFVGVNDGNIPKTGDKGGLLSSTEKENLQQRGYELSPTPREEMYTQRLYLYMNLLKPSDRLFLSYSTGDGSGKSVFASYLIDVLKKLFPELKEESVRDRVTADMLVNPEDSLRYYASLLRGYSEGILSESEKKLTGALYRLYTEEGLKTAEDITEAAFSEYVAKPLSAEIVKLLYSAVLRASVSRMETYAGCAYSFFLQYGMGLKENDDFDFKSSDLGNIYHGVLDNFSSILERSGKTWADFTPEEGRELVERAVAEYCENYEQGMLKEDERSAYTVSKITRMMLRTVETLQYQLKRGSFNVAAHELSFERKLDFEGGELLLRGKIDRIDLTEQGGRIYVKVVDYKSGKHELDLTDIYYGLNQQLAVYMAEALHHEKELHPGMEVVPSAMLYYIIDNPMISSGELSKDESVENRILKDLRPNGIIEASEDNIDSLDRDFEGTSLAIPLARKKDGALQSNSLKYVASSEEINHMTDYVEGLIRRMAGEIYKGNIEISPAKRKDRSACDFCSFHGICRYDEHFPGFSPREADIDPEEAKRIVMGGADNA